MENHNFKKKFGQNFLRDNNILDKIANSFDIENGTIIEVGPGDGALTKRLIKKECNVFAFEIDTSLKKYLDNILSEKLKVIYGDFLNVSLSDYFKKDQNIYVVANIPYYITTPIITKFIDENIIPKEMVLMVQKEVAERLSSKPKNKEYGAISVILSYYFDILYLFTVNRNCFYPIPNVESAVIKLKKRESLLPLNSFDNYKNLVYDAFKQKRKTLRNNLKKYDLEKIESILLKYNLSLNSRAEEVDYEVFVDICNNI